MTLTRTAIVLTTSALLLTLAACSSDDEPDPEQTTSEASPTESSTETEPDEPTPTEGEDDQGDTAALEQAVRDYTDAYFAPDPDAAYDTLSARCQDSIDPATYERVVEQAATDYGQLGVETFSVDDLSGDMARVTYTVGLPLFDEQLARQPWVREDGEWRYDAC